MENEKQKEKQLTPKKVYGQALLKKCYEKDGQPQIAQKVFLENEKECKENAINNDKSLIAIFTSLASDNLATKQKTTYNDKIVTAYIPL